MSNFVDLVAERVISLHDQLDFSRTEARVALALNAELVAQKDRALELLKQTEARLAEVMAEREALRAESERVSRQVAAMISWVTE